MIISESTDGEKAFPSLFIKQKKRNVFHNHLGGQGMSQPEMCSVLSCSTRSSQSHERIWSQENTVFFFFSFSCMDEGAEEEVRR